MTTVIDHRPPAGQPKHPDRKVAECATCPGHCCKNDLIVLHEDEGDDPANYDVVEVPHPLTGRTVLALDHKPNGDCVYLAEVDGVGRCSVYDRRPVICRTFDCGRSFLAMDRASRRQMIKAGLASKDVMDMGRRRVEAARARIRLQDGRKALEGPTLPATPPEGPRRPALAAARALGPSARGPKAQRPPPGGT